LHKPPVGFVNSCDVSPKQIVSGIATRLIVKGPEQTTVIVTISAMLTQAVTISVAVNINIVVVFSREVVGSSVVASTRRLAGVQLYI